MAPGFTMTDADLSLKFKPAVLISLPNFADYAHSKISTLPYERLVIRLKDPFNKE